MIHASRTLLVVSLCPALLAVRAQLANGGFEETSVQGEDTIPNDWSVSSGFGGGSIQDGNTGDWSLGVWHWYWYGPGIAANGSSALDHYDGQPFTGTPAALTGFYKRYVGSLELDQTSNDSGQVKILLTRWNASLFQRDTVAFGARAFGEQAAWSPFTIGINYLLSGAPDTLVVQLLSGIDCFCGIGSNGNCCYLYVDDLALETDNGISAPLFATEPAGLFSCGDGQLEVRVGEGTPLPLVLRLHDPLGRLVDERVVRRDRERITVPTTGLLGFRFTHGTSVVGSGQVMPY